jgi:NADPH:quinone reductase-like Zn-dependent oxidoreductase
MKAVYITQHGGPEVLNYSDHRGALHGVVDRVFPLDQVAEAHKVMESREFFGKLVVES